MVAGGCGADANNGNSAGDGGDACTPGQTRCHGTTFQTCVSGAFQDQMECANPHVPKVCHDILGCVDCRPGDLTCVGNEQHGCNDDGTVGGTLQVCASSCVGGQCVDACTMAEQQRSYVGCEYFAVDLENGIEVLGPPVGGQCGNYGLDAMIDDGTMPVCHFANASQPGSTMGICDYGNDCSAEGPPDVFMCSPVQVCVWDAQHSPFAIVVSNPDGENAVAVTISNKAGMSQTVSVRPGEVVPIYPQALGFPDQSLQYSGIEDKAYRIVSSRPIVAYQFNPLNNVHVFSNDASLLLPRHALDKVYFPMSWPTLTRRPNTNDYNGFVTVVATEPGTTSVTVSPRGHVRAGLNVPAFGPGQPQTFTLEQFQTLNLEAIGADQNGLGARGDDLTGSMISADRPVAVFGGHVSSNLSATSSVQCCTDHLEEQIYPASAWGKHYAIVRTQERHPGQPDLVRVLAMRPNTTVTVAPNMPTACPFPLNTGEFCDFFFTQDLEITANEPVLVGHLTTSSGSTMGNLQVGDPSLSLGVPVEQYRKSYTFLVPQAYDQNFVSVVASGQQRVTLDGQDVTIQFASFGAGGLQKATFTLQPGQHKVDCPQSCGIEVYGWSIDVSYMFAGGLDLNQIVVP
jgi:hypothetical protein